MTESSDPEILTPFLAGETKGDAGRKEICLNVEGMVCSSCTGMVTNAFSSGQAVVCH